MQFLFLLLIPIFSILSIALFFAVTFGRRLNETIFLSSVSIILVLYLCGLMNFRGSLLLGYLLVLLFALLSSISMFLRRMKNRAVFNNVAVNKGLMLYFLFLVYSLFINYGRLFYHWDEFSYWGILVKHMYLFDAFATYIEPGMSSITGRAYLPGLSLFQYLWVRPFPDFMEYPLYVAANMLFFSIILVFLNDFNSRTVAVALSVFLFPLYLSSLSFPFVSVIYMDGMISVFFSTSLLFYFYYRKEKSSFGILMVTAATSMLVWVKDVGQLLFGIVVLVMLVDAVIFRKGEINKLLFFETSFSERIKRAVMLAAPLVSFMFIQLSWRMLLKNTTEAIMLQQSLLEVEFDVSEMINMPNILGLFSLNGTSRFSIYLTDVLGLVPYQLEVINSFGRALISRGLYVFGFSYLQMLLLFFCTAIIVALLLKKQGFSITRPTLNYFLIMFLCKIYTVFLLVYYVFIQPDYQAVYLNSFERYLYPWSYCLSMSLLIFLILMPKHKRFSLTDMYHKFKPYIIFTLVALIAALMLNVLRIVYTHKLYEGKYSYADYAEHGAKLVHRFIVIPFRGISISDVRSFREPFDHIRKWSDYLYEEEKRCYFISQGSDGFEVVVTNYILYPKLFRLSGYSISTEPYYNRYDPFTLIIDADTWGTLLVENYDYVYIFYHDQKFKDIYGHMFDKLSNTMLYSVTVNQDGNPALLAVE